MVPIITTHRLLVLPCCVPEKKTAMKRLSLIIFLSVLSASLHAQAVDATVCDVLKNPESFNGKTVRIKGTVSAGFDEFIIKAEDCHYPIGGIWLSYPEGTKAKSGPVAIVQLQPAKNFSGVVAPADRAPVTLDKNKDFKQFDSQLAAQYKANGICLGCTKYEVSATLMGRLDAVVPGLRRNDSGQIIAISGFGNLNAYPARLVLQSVAEVAAHEIDYSKAAGATGGDAGFENSGAGDPIAAAHAIAKVFGPNNVLGEQIERAANALGKPGEDNGVEVGFSGGNEAAPGLEQKADKVSPDGVLYHCALDQARLRGTALALAIAHISEHVADIREPQTATLYNLENRAWVTTALTAIGARQKTLTIPGGYVIWSAAWPQADINTLSGQALTEFLTKQALLGQ